MHGIFQVFQKFSKEINLKIIPFTHSFFINPQKFIVQQKYSSGTTFFPIHNDVGYSFSGYDDDTLSFFESLTPDKYPVSVCLYQSELISP